MKRLLIATVLLAGGCVFPESVDLILLNGNIVTLDESQPKAQALAAKDGRIVAIGSTAEIRKVYRSAETIDLEAKTAVPGLIDAHMHFSRLGKRGRELFLDGKRGPDAIIDIVKAQVAVTPKGQWIIGKGWHTVDWDNKTYPTHEALSAASPDHPVYLAGMANHAAWVNEKAMELAKIDKHTPSPPGGTVVKDKKTRKPTGILLESARGFVTKLLPKDTRESRKADIVKGIEIAHGLGLTSVHDAGVGRDEVELYEELLAEGKLTLRLYVMWYVPNAGEEFEKFLDSPPRTSPFLSTRAFKAYADGALGARGAALLEPYEDQAEWRGQMQNSEEELTTLLRKATKAKYQVCIHAIGDRGNRAVLDAVQTVSAENPGVDLRTRIEHAQVLHLDDIPRLRKLGVIASMQPIHGVMDAGFAPSRLGDKRMAGAYAWKKILDSGARLAASADVPAFPLEYSDPRRGMHAAVQKVSRLDALKMYTAHAAYAAFEEADKGTLAVGKLADITVFDRDILAGSDDDILKTNVVLTIVDGHVVFKATALDPSP